MFPTAAPDQEEDEEVLELRGKEGNTERPLIELEREGERGRRWSMTAAPTNVGAALFHFPGHVIWSLCFLWIALDL